MITPFKPNTWYEDTICALATPFGQSALAVIRVTGTTALDIVSQFLMFAPPSEDLHRFPGHHKPAGVIPVKTQVFRLFHDMGLIIDQVMVVYHRAPKSYTGEDLIEITCHGGEFIYRQIMAILMRHARLARPGEFTQRAVINNRLDLVRAEAVNDLITAQTAVSHRLAMENVNGALTHRVREIMTLVTECRMKLEVGIDFVEENDDEIEPDAILISLRHIVDSLRELVDTAHEGMVVRDGFKVVIAGPPNVGKSSLFNALLKTDRAIVTPVPGTTRDYLEETVSMEGYLFRFFDTAGLRETEDQAEQIGVLRSLALAGEAHLVLLVSEPGVSENALLPFMGAFEGCEIMKVLNKADLAEDNHLLALLREDWVTTRSVDPIDLDMLRHRLLEQVRISQEAIHRGMLTNPRQEAACRKALGSAEKALESMNNGLGFEFTAFDLDETASALGDLVGDVTSAEILDRIFIHFCIGK